MPRFAKDTLASAPQALPEIENIMPDTPDISMLESALRGGAQGLTFGFADEIAGGIESAIDPNKTYEQARNESRANFRAAEEANPNTFLAGDIAGSVLPALIPGAAGVSIGRASLGLAGRAATGGIAKMAGQAALAGAVEGLGRSEGERVSDLVKDTVVGGVTGGLVGGAVGKLGQKVSQGVDALPSPQKLKESLETKVLGGITGLSDEGVDVLRKNPDALKRIEKLGEGTADDVATRVASEIQNFAERNPIKQRLNQKYESAMSVLDNSRATVDLTPVKEAIQERVAKFDVGGGRAFGENAQFAQDYLNDFSARLTQAFPDGVIDAPNAKRVINQLRQDIDKYGGWMNPNANSEIGTALKDIQKEIDSQLKTQIPEFRTLMKDVQKDTVLNERFTKQFITKNYGVDESKIKNFIKNQVSGSPNPKNTKLLNQLSGAMAEFGEQPLASTIEDLRLKKMIEGRSNQGSNLVNAAGAIGAGIGGTLGGGLGAAGGAAIGGGIGKRLETTGRKFASDYLARQANKQPMILSKASGTKYGRILQDAAQRGTRNFAVAHYLLEQQDPEYRQMMQEENNE